MEDKTCLIYCKCGAGIFGGEQSEQLTGTLKKYNADVYELHDLCAFSISEKDFLNELGKKYSHKYIIACYPRAIKNMMLQNDIDLGAFEVINFREKGTEQIIEKINNQIKLPAGNANYKIKKSKLDVPAWFPVIDKSRCILCGQCSRFCLFGVYKFDKKSLKVVNPLECKDNCPACGRTCPTSAVIFPRMLENSVLSGAEPDEEQKTMKPVGDTGLFVLLNERNRNRRNIFREGFVQQAEEERNKALAEFRNLKNKKK